MSFHTDGIGRWKRGKKSPTCFGIDERIQWLELSHFQVVCALKKLDRKTAAGGRQVEGTVWASFNREVSKWLKEHLGLGLSLRILSQAGCFLFSHFNKYIVPAGQLGVFGGIWVDRTFRFPYLNTHDFSFSFPLLILISVTQDHTTEITTNITEKLPFENLNVLSESSLSSMVLKHWMLLIICCFFKPLCTCLLCHLLFLSNSFSPISC